MQYSHPEADFYRKHGVLPPSVSQHGTEDEIREKLTPLKAHSWHLVGNQLIGQTDWGELVQTIPTTHILTGMDDRGLPIFRKVGIS